MDDKLQEKLLLHEHAWRYFELHANQRIILFRFYIIFESLFATAACFLIIRFPYSRNIHEWITIAISLIFLGLTIIFNLIDRRNRKFIHLAEKALRQLETESPFIDNLKIFTSEKNQKNCVTHTRCFQAIFIFGYMISVLLIVLSVISIFYVWK